MNAFRKFLSGIFTRDSSYAGRPRDPKWDEFAEAWKRDHPACVCCGSESSNRAVHHIVPFWLAPERELDQSNVATVCHNDGCHGHLQVGHSGDWRAYNEHFLFDAQVSRQRRRERRYSL